MLSADYFDALYSGNSDPWEFKTRWYEVRKRALMLAMLPMPRYRHAFEPGCANGEFTVELAARCDRVSACDISHYAVNLTRQRLAKQTRVAVSQAVIPAQWPALEFDLIVFNEIGYYLSAVELQQVLNCIEKTLAPDGIVLVCHWRHSLDDCELDGPSVHAVFEQCLALKRRIHHSEHDFLLDIYVSAHDIHAGTECVP